MVLIDDHSSGHSITLNSWDDIHQHSKRGWLFRGQERADWELQTSFERFCNNNGFPPDRRATTEDQLLREFKRAYHHYHSRVPQTWIEWLSVMQHHGAPTRMLDFT